MRVVRGRLAGVSIRASLVSGAWVGFALGLVFGALLGAILSWFCGAIIDWQRELSLTMGVTATLLPFGDQIDGLRWISETWYLVIPLGALAVGLLAALLGAVIGALLAAAYNRSPRHASVVVELEAEPMASGAAIDPAAGAHGEHGE